MENKENIIMSHFDSSVNIENEILVHQSIIKYFDTSKGHPLVKASQEALELLKMSVEDAEVLSELDLDNYTRHVILKLISRN